MPKLAKARSQKAGLPPGSLIHVGDRRGEHAKISLTRYSLSEHETTEITHLDQCPSSPDPSGITWVNVEGIHRPDIIEKLGQCFNLHPLVLEDIAEADQRPKIEDHRDYLYIVLKMLSFAPNRDDVSIEQVSLIVGRNYVLSFQEGTDGDVFSPVRERLRNEKSRLRRTGADYLAYSLVDAVVDNYFAVLEGLGERVESIEQELIATPAQKTLNQIRVLKRHMIFLRRSVWPLREVLSQLERTDSSLVHESTRIYLRDVYDHTIQVIDEVETFRDMLSGMLDVYLSSISNRLNAVMKVLTIIATIFMPLTFLAGVYGMNFKHMPELDWPWGYPMILSVMAAVAISMLLYFKRKKWL